MKRCHCFCSEENGKSTADEKEAKQRMAELEKALLEVGDHPHAVEIPQEGTNEAEIDRILVTKGWLPLCL